MVNREITEDEEEFSEEERRAFRRQIESKRISEVTVTELDSRGRPVRFKLPKLEKPEFKSSELESLQKEIKVCWGVYLTPKADFLITINPIIRTAAIIIPIVGRKVAISNTP